MEEINRFVAYATEFEKTLVDDDWSRLEACFTEDAVYEVTNTAFDSRIEGRAALIAGMRKSVDGFDRRCDERQIAVRRGPVVVDGQVEIDWAVTYRKSGAPDLVLEGGSVARFDGNRISYLCDRFPDGMSDQVAAWVDTHAPGLSFSYT